MKKILHNWWGWLLFIVIIRLLFIFLGSPTTTSDEAVVKNLLSSTMTDPEKDIRITSSEVLHESLLAFPQHREWILTTLKKASVEAKYSQEIKNLLTNIEEDPLYQLSIAVEKPDLPIFFYIEPLLLAIPVIYGIVFLLFIPFFISSVVGVNATIKLYGRRGKIIFYCLIVSTWMMTIASYIFYPKLIVIAHAMLILVSLLLLFLLVFKKLLALFLDIPQKICWIAFLLLFALGSVSFVSYFDSIVISPTAQIKVSQGKILNAIESLEKKHYEKAKPLLIQILRVKVYQSSKITIKAIEKMGVIGDYDHLGLLSTFLESSDILVRKAALEATFKIIKKFAK